MFRKVAEDVENNPTLENALSKALSEAGIEVSDSEWMRFVFEMKKFLFPTKSLPNSAVQEPIAEVDDFIPSAEDWLNAALRIFIGKPIARVVEIQVNSRYPKRVKRFFNRLSRTTDLRRAVEGMYSTGKIVPTELHSRTYARLLYDDGSHRDFQFPKGRFYHE